MRRQASSPPSSAQIVTPCGFLPAASGMRKLHSFQATLSTRYPRSVLWTPRWINTELDFVSVRVGSRTRASNSLTAHFARSMSTSTISHASMEYDEEVRSASARRSTSACVGFVGASGRNGPKPVTKNLATPSRMAARAARCVSPCFLRHDAQLWRGPRENLGHLRGKARMLASTIVVLEIARLGMRDGLKSGLQTLCGCPCSKNDRARGCYMCVCRGVSSAPRKLPTHQAEP